MSWEDLPPSLVRRFAGRPDVLAEHARQRMGLTPHHRPRRAAAADVPWVGPDADDATACEAVGRCPARCTTCRGTRCRGGLRDGMTARLDECLACVRRPMEPPPTMPDSPAPLPVKMVAPSDLRPGIWRGGVLQIHVTRACDQACYHCTQGSNLGGKPVVMTPDQFEAAVRSLDGYFGVVGVFGGNPAMHPQFGDLCEILRAHVPWEQRGIWCNHPRGKGRTMAVTFNPRHSNLNVHLDGEAAAEFRRDWPECSPYLKGESDDSVHSSPWVAIKDVIPDEAERWKMIGECDVNRHWSALIGVVPGRGLRAYFCELAYAQAALHAGASDAADWPDTGLEVAPGWWRLPMEAFADQVRLHCHSCGIPLRRAGQRAIGGEVEEFSATHAALARPKVRGRAVQVVESIGVVARERPATEYLPGTTPKARA